MLKIGLSAPDLIAKLSNANLATFLPIISAWIVNNIKIEWI